MVEPVPSPWVGVPLECTHLKATAEPQVTPDTVDWKQGLWATGMGADPLGWADQEGRWLLGLSGYESLWAIISYSYHPQSSLNNHQTLHSIITVFQKQQQQKNTTQLPAQGPLSS